LADPRGLGHPLHPIANLRAAQLCVLQPKRIDDLPHCHLPFGIAYLQTGQGHLRIASPAASSYTALATRSFPFSAAQFDPVLLEPKPKFNEDVVTTSNDREFYIVHQYDRVPELREKIERKFG
jgi:hypothetical protein